MGEIIKNRFERACDLWSQEQERNIKSAAPARTRSLAEVDLRRLILRCEKHAKDADYSTEFRQSALLHQVLVGFITQTSLALSTVALCGSVWSLILTTEQHILFDVQAVEKAQQLLGSLTNPGDEGDRCVQRSEVVPAVSFILHNTLILSRTCVTNQFMCLLPQQCRFKRTGEAPRRCAKARGPQGPARTTSIRALDPTDGLSTGHELGRA
eukprot:776314-Prorocentrum_minimum.AAC.5